MILPRSVRKLLTWYECKCTVSRSNTKAVTFCRVICKGIVSTSTDRVEGQPNLSGSVRTCLMREHAHPTHPTPKTLTRLQHVRLAIPYTIYMDWDWERIQNGGKAWEEKQLTKWKVTNWELKGVPYRLFLFLHSRGHLGHGPIDGWAVGRVRDLRRPVNGQDFGGVQRPGPKRQLTHHDTSSPTRTTNTTNRSCHGGPPGPPSTTWDTGDVRS